MRASAAHASERFSAKRRPSNDFMMPFTKIGCERPAACLAAPMPVNTLRRSAAHSGRRDPVLECRDSVTNREAHQTRKILDAELLHDAAAVCIDARRREVEPARCLLARQAGNHQIEHFALTAAETIDRVGLTPAHLDDMREHIPRLSGPIATKR